MSVKVVVGTQWGDEAKGKIVDALSANADFVLRVAGGSNAGHTVYANGKKYSFHLIPSGILNPKTTCILASNVVINLRRIIDEIAGVKAQGVAITPQNLMIDINCHVVLPVHQMVDKRDGGEIGTTGQGIGPTYSDKMARFGVRLKDLLCENVNAKNVKAKGAPTLLKQKYEAFWSEEMWQEQIRLAHELSSYIKETFWIVDQAQKENKKIIVEGAHGTLLDLHYGEYPYVTSSSTVSAGACLGTSIGPRNIDDIIGVAKAYSTRVGGGPMLTELVNTQAELELGQAIRVKGKEFGTTTGRPRRIGWPDLVVLKYAVTINSLDALAITLLDVLSGLDEIYLCTHYQTIEKGESIITDEYPCGGDISRYTPVYEKMLGWKEDITGAKSFDELPEAAKNYLLTIEKKLKCPIRYISVGPQREQLIQWKKEI